MMIGKLGITFVCAVLCWAAVSPVVARPDHALWDKILKQQLKPGARFDYKSLKAHPAELEQYINQVAAPWPKDMSAAERKAALINAYNALTVGWIIANYPVASIWRTQHPFSEVRHKIDWHMVSLDGIETELRNMGDPRIHGTMVCASLGCPPLRGEAYFPDKLESQIDNQVRAWLANPALHTYDAALKTATISKIFDWYKGDFGKNGKTVRDFVIRFAPAGKADFLLDPASKIKYTAYKWGLNDISNIGENYSGVQFYADYLRNNI